MDRFQLRRDTAARWAEVNPILLEGEVGFETDTKRRKIGDGVHRWNVLEYLAAENIVQETGDSDKVVMSQKAVTEKLSELGSKVNNLEIPNLVFFHIQSDGSLSTNNDKNLLFDKAIYLPLGAVISADSGYKFQLAVYADDGNFKERISWNTLYTIPTNDCFYLIELSKDPEVSLVDTSIIEHLHIESRTVADIQKVSIPKNINKSITLGNVGDVVDLTLVETSSVNCSVIDCIPNDVFYINARIDNPNKAVAFLDKNNVILSIVSGDVSIKEEIIAPEKASKLIINSRFRNISFKYNTDISNRLIINKHNFQNIEDRLEDAEDEINSLKGEDSEVLCMEKMSNLVFDIGFDTFKERMLQIKRNEKYNSWSFIQQIGNKLYCVYTKGDGHTDNVNASIYIKESYDGIVWSKETNIINNKGARDNVTGKGVGPNGELLVWNRVGKPGYDSTYFELYKSSNGVEFEKVTTIKNDSSDAVAHISDIISVPNVGYISFFNTYNNTTNAFGIFKSSDGVTWNKQVIASGLTKYDCPTEISCAYIGDGKIIGLGRRENNDGGVYVMFQVQSNDYGVTWTTKNSNIGDIALSTPSIIFDDSKSELTVFYVRRNKPNSILKVRVSKVEDVWNNPTNWAESRDIHLIPDATAQDSGNANATFFNGRKFCSYYSGNESDAGIYITFV